MTESLSAVLGKHAPTFSEIEEAISRNGSKKINLSQKLRKKLIIEINGAIEDTSSRGRATHIIHTLSQHVDLIEKIANDGPTLSGMCERMLTYAIDVNQQPREEAPYLVGTVNALIDKSDRLKTQLGCAILERSIAAFAQPLAEASLLAKLMRLLVSAVSRSRTNKALFARRITDVQIRTIVIYIKETFDPMGQAYAAEFLWRILSVMKESRPPSELSEVYGEMYCLRDVSVCDFCDGIRHVLRKINEAHQNIVSLDATNLSIGSSTVSGNHTIDIGDTRIVIWIARDAVWSRAGGRTDAVVLRREDIIGVGANDRRWCIRLADGFDTLPDCFERGRRAITFEAEDRPDALGIAESRFGSLDPNSLVFGGLGSQTPRPSTQRTQSQKKPTTSQTPNVRAKIPKKMRFISSSSSADSDAGEYYNDDQVDSIESDGDEIPMPKPDLSMLHKSPKKTEKAKPAPKTKSKSKPKHKATPSPAPKPKTVPSPSRPKKIERLQKIDNDSKKIVTPKKAERRRVQIPPPPPPSPPMSSSSESNDFGLDFDSSITEEEPAQKEVESGTEAVEIPEAIVSQGFSSAASSPEVPPKTDDRPCRPSPPQRWELEAFDELKAFAGALSARVGERQSSVSRAIDNAAGDAAGEAAAFMARCDEELERLRADFIAASSKISDDIASRQGMVEQLGAQQGDHIEQMRGDVVSLARRCRQVVKRIEAQKAQVLANQAKHIALFRDDIKSEFRSAVTSKRREYSKTKVQRLVSLLEEL